jgi:triacylglycerol lipase
MTQKRKLVVEDEAEADVSLLDEARVGIELLLLHTAPVYYGFGVPRGDGSGVVLIPGFLSADLYLMEIYGWLRRIGYRPYFSGIGLNAECPNLLIQRRLNHTLETALKETGRKIHMVGHSLGGIIARSIAGQRPADIASVTTLGAPFRGAVAHSSILRAAEVVRKHILLEHGTDVLPNCYTGRCTCDFLDSLRRKVSSSVFQTAIYTRADGVVDWHHCVTDDPKIDCEVSGTHLGLAFNPAVYYLIATRMAKAQVQEPEDCPRKGNGKAIK